MLAVVGTFLMKDFLCLRERCALKTTSFSSRREESGEQRHAGLASRRYCSRTILGNAPPYTCLVGDIGPEGKSKALRAVSQALAEKSFRSDDLSLPAA